MKLLEMENICFFFGKELPCLFLDVAAVILWYYVILWVGKSEENYVGLKIHKIYNNIWERKSEENYVGLKIKIELSTKYGRAIYESYKSALTNIILFFKDLLKKSFHGNVPLKKSMPNLNQPTSIKRFSFKVICDVSLFVAKLWVCSCQGIAKRPRICMFGH